MVQLILFDCDGTLVDSQHVIVATMGRAFAAHGRTPPTANEIKRIVGLSLETAMAALAPDLAEDDHVALAALYREHFRALRRERQVQEPMFDGALAVLEALKERGILTGIATGKGLRGLQLVLEAHGIADFFVTLQTADCHPSKPHPSMIVKALEETGAMPEQAWLVGDTSFDMEMAKAAGIRPIGVSWGYHPVGALEAAGASVVLDRFDQLLTLLEAGA